MHSNKSYRSIGEHRVMLPKMPTDKRDIFFYDERKENQNWQRDKLISKYRDLWFDFIPNYSKMWQNSTYYNDDGLLETLNNEDSQYIDGLYLQEQKRRVEGVWFFNNGEPTWITGDHYFLLMYARIQRHDGEGQYGDYREFQADYFRLIHHCRSSDKILGMFVSKPKKTGVTNIHWSGYYLNKATLYKNKNLGYMNIIQNQAAKTFNDYFMYSYNGMISPLKPAFKNKSEVDGSIIFGTTHTSSKKVRKPNSEENELNTSVFCVPTKPKAFDVAVMSDITFDEPTKYKESFGEIWRTNKEAVKIQSKINGKAWLFNYTPDQDSDSFREAREVFLNSELRTIKPNTDGKTESELICWHIPAFAAWEGCFDKYGICEQSRAAAEIEHGRVRVSGTPKTLQALIRQYANTKKEAWATGGAGSAFDNIRLGDLLSDIELDESAAPESLGVEGKLKWTNEYWEIGLFNKRPRGQFCPVKFVPLTKEELARGDVGKMRQYNEIPLAHQNYALKFGRDDDGLLLPPPKFLYCLGGDPTSQAAASEVIEGSKNAFYTMSRPDEGLDSLFGRIMTNVINLEYFARPEIANEAYEDLVKQIIYTGSVCAVEANVATWPTLLMEEGLGHYMIVRNENGVPSLWKRYMGLPAEEDKKYSLIRTTGNQDNKTMIEHFMTLAKNYFYKPEEGAKDYGSTIKSGRLIKQCMDLNPMDTKLFDLFMGWGYCLWANDIYTNILMTPEEDLYSSYNIGSVLAALMR